MAQEKIEIKFIAKGNVPLVKAIKELHKATQKLNGQLTRLSKTNVSAAKAQDLINQRVSRNTTLVKANSTAYTRLQSVISVYRNKMLLASFAVGLAIKPMLQLADLAGRVEEVMNKANVVFGDNIDIVNQWAEALGGAVGRASSTLIEMASGLQDTFVPLGFTREAATQLSTSLTQLAIDVGSFSNKLDADVIRDFQSAIVGNHETVQKYGIIINEARLEEEAFSLGITDTVRALNAQEKVQARVSLITKGSIDAINDAMNTSDSYSNTMKRLKDEWKEYGEKVGESLKPIIKNLAITVSSERTYRTLAIIIAGVATSYVAVHRGALLATFATQKFNRAIVRTGLGALVVGLGVLIERFMFAGKETNDFKKELEDINQVMIDNVTSIMDSEAIERERIKVFREEREVYQKSLDSLTNRILLIGETTTAEKYAIQIGRELTDEEEALIKVLDRETKAWNDKFKAQQLIESGFKATVKGHNAMIKAKMKLIEAEVESAKATLKSKVGLELYQDILDKAIEQEEDFEFTFKETTDTIIQGGIALEIYKNQLKALPTFQERVEGGILKIADSLNTVSSISLTKFADTFKETYDEIEFETNNSSEAARAAWTEAAFEMAAMAADAVTQYVEAEMQIAQKQGRQQLEALKSSRRFDKMSARQKKQAEDDITDATNKSVLQRFKQKQDLNRIAVIMDTAMGITRALADPGGVHGIILSSLIGAMGAIQLAVINKQQPPKMAEGGLIGGRLHSQGGTLIEAERGEFVMSRRAVETAGLETMNRINSGMGSGGSINITFSGNINSDEFIESEAIPKIREAIRRGADIGEV